MSISNTDNMFMFINYLTDSKSHYGWQYDSRKMSLEIIRLIFNRNNIQQRHICMLKDEQFSNNNYYNYSSSV